MLHASERRSRNSSLPASLTQPELILLPEEELNRFPDILAELFSQGSPEAVENVCKLQAFVGHPVTWTCAEEATVHSDCYFMSERAKKEGIVLYEPMHRCLFERPKIEWLRKYIA